MTTLSSLQALADGLQPAERMPAIFVGHGNPMNAITDNSYHRSWAKLGKELPRPKAILSISAHWLTPKTRVTIMAKPQTIHDFGGFPRQLFEQQYPAPGTPEMAHLTQKLVTHTAIEGDEKWGLDHGTWSVLLPMYPMADIPVYQLSIVYEQPPAYHYELGKQLAQLRDKGVLIIGSGNLVHNLAQIDWNGTGQVYEWAAEFDGKIKSWLDGQDDASLLSYQSKLGKLADMAHPSNDHFLPLFYVMGLRQKTDELRYFNDQFDMGSISMRSFVLS